MNYRPLPRETLFDIAVRFTGDGNRWVELFEVNRLDDLERWLDDPDFKINLPDRWEPDQPDGGRG